MNKQDKKKPDAKAQETRRKRQDQECVQLLQEMHQLHREMKCIDNMILNLRTNPYETDPL